MKDAPESENRSLREGLLVADRYRLRERRGTGAWGSVWKAEHVTLGHPVAIKFLHLAVASEAHARARFAREAKILARLGEQSRHVTRVIDHGVLPDGTPFLVMEFLEGEGLDARLHREERLPLELVVTITAQLARALQAAHELGVVHRDLKPANVFLCRDEDGALLAKLLDFGVAKATIENEPFITSQKGALIGTPNYMSPEQMTDGATVDARADLWALGAMVYRMLTGRPAFGKGAIQELALRILTTDPLKPTEIVPTLPKALDDWFATALAKKPSDRFQSARALAESLATASGVHVSFRPEPMPKPRAMEAAPMSEGTLLPASSTLDERKLPLSPNWPLRIVLLAVVAGVIAMTILVLTRR